MQWSGRNYVPGDFEHSDKVNGALTAANTSLYGAVHAVTVSLGCAAGLGFVHTGHDRSFVYDIADLYKAELAIPTAFDVASMDVEDIGATTRRIMRDRIHETHLLERCSADIHRLLLPEENETILIDMNVVALWDGGIKVVRASHNYSEDDSMEDL